MLHLFHNLGRDFAERRCHRMAGIRRDNRIGVVAAFAQLAHERKLAQERNPKFFCVARAAAVRKDLVAAATLAADVIAHVLDHAEHGHVDLAEHLDAALYVDKREVLRRGDDNAAGKRDALRNRKLRIAGAGRKIEHQAIEIAPFDIDEKFRLELGHHRPAPDDRVLIVDEKRHRDVADAEAFEGDDPAVGRERYRLFDADHHCDARSVDIGIHQADAPSSRAHRQCQVDGDRRFADAALAAGHGHDVLNAGHVLARLGAGGRGARRGVCQPLDSHFNGRHLRHRADGSPDFADNLINHFGLGGRGGERHRDARERNLDVLDHAERHDVAAEPGVPDFLQFGEYFVGAGHSGSSIRRSAFASGAVALSMPSSHVIIPGLREKRRDPPTEFRSLSQERSKSRAGDFLRIRYPARPAREVALTAASELQGGLAAMIGRDVPVQDDAQLDAREMVLDFAESEGASGSAGTTLAGDSFAIARAGEDSISIRAGSDRGLIHGAADLLEKLGANFPPGVPPVFPRIDAQRLRKIEPYTVTPSFARRAFVSDIMTWNYNFADRLELHLRHDREFIPWMARRGANAFSYIRHAHDTRLRIDEIAPLLRDHGIGAEYGGHVLQILLPRERFESDPSMFPADDDGKRQPRGNLCVSNRAAIDLVRDGALRYVAEYPENELVHIWGADVWRGAWCRCGACRELAPQHQYMEVVNAIAESLGEASAPPVAYLAYHDTIDPYPGLKPLA